LFGRIVGGVSGLHVSSCFFSLSVSVGEGGVVVACGLREAESSSASTWMTSAGMSPVSMLLLLLLLLLLVVDVSSVVGSCEASRPKTASDHHSCCCGGTFAVEIIRWWGSTSQSATKRRWPGRVRSFRVRGESLCWLFWRFLLVGWLGGLKVGVWIWVRLVCVVLGFEREGS